MSLSRDAINQCQAVKKSVHMDLSSGQIIPTIIYMLLLLYFVFSTIFAEGWGYNGNLEPSSILRPSDQWLWHSATNKFSLGFWSSEIDGMYMVGIAYGSIKVPTLVWTASGGM